MLNGFVLMSAFGIKQTMFQNRASVLALFVMAAIETVSGLIPVTPASGHPSLALGIFAENNAPHYF